MNDYDRMAELRREWKAPRELAGGMREVELTRTGTALMVVAGLLAVSGIAAGVGISRLAFSQELSRRALDQRGIVAQGVITRVWRDHDSEGESHGMVAYEFPFQGQVYRGKSGAPERRWRELTEGKPIDVRFIPADPTKNHPAVWRPSVVPSWLGVPVALLLFAAASALWLAMRRQTALLSEGRPAPAIVTEHIRAKEGKVWRYQFPLLGGSIQKGRGAATRKPPAVGSVVCVLYDPENPRRNAPYPLALVRLAR